MDVVAGGSYFDVVGAGFDEVFGGSLYLELDDGLALEVGLALEDGTYLLVLDGLALEDGGTYLLVLGFGGS